MQERLAVHTRDNVVPERDQFLSEKEGMLFVLSKIRTLSAVSRPLGRCLV